MTYISAKTLSIPLIRMKLEAGEWITGCLCRPGDICKIALIQSYCCTLVLKLNHDYLFITDKNDSVG